MRRPILAANWKMYKTVGEALAFIEEFLPHAEEMEAIDIVLAPPFTALEPVARALAGTPLKLAGQNVGAHEEGAFTGEVAPRMLADLGCAYTIVGHSERRQWFGETDELIARKAALLLAHGIRPIVCVGETLSQRESGQTFHVVSAQLEASLDQIPVDRAEEVVVAYEPVWAIGTGRTATPALAQEVHAFVRERLGKAFGEAAAQMRIQYGGSVKPDNVYALMAEQDIDGALVGGASLDPRSFSRIVRFDRPEETE
ncbi:MAG TPA: triose-phosphate isomerase [Myxococcota bacterium]|nr:triose-phosphate isomerase [Myxococcota bacterium]